MDELLQLPVDYARIAAMWVRSSLAYPVSFWTMAVSSLLMSGLDFVGIWLMFHTIDNLGGFGLREIALLYGASGIGIGVADLLIGSVESIGQHVRTGTLDTMMVRPVPLLVQVCADKFALRRLGRITQVSAVAVWGAGAVDWDLGKVLIALMMVVSSSVIFFALFCGISCLQFWTHDASEAANAFTYGGNTMTQYPLTIYPVEVVKSLTFVLPIAFVNWYPCLALLERPDPFGFPEWFAWLPPVVALILAALAALAWRTGIRHYTSTGS
ncbi:MAG: ABC transporter permease [Nocardioides sp.]